MKTYEQYFPKDSKTQFCEPFFRDLIQASSEQGEDNEVSREMIIALGKLLEDEEERLDHYIESLDQLTAVVAKISDAVRDIREVIGEEHHDKSFGKRPCICKVCSNS